MAVYDIAVLGATGEVGQAILSILDKRNFPVGKLYPLASSRSAGEPVMFKNRPVLVEDAEGFDFSKVKIAFFSAGAAISKKYVPIATEAGCIVIDNTSEFRYEADVPLVIAEVNPERVADYKNRNLIANPNCSTMQMLVALKPIYDAVGITRINVATYQSVSGTGKDAILELVKQTGELINGRSVKPSVYPVQIAFNVVPQIDDFQENGYTKEEMKMHWETQKIFEDSEIQVNATTVRVPVFYGHSEALHIETRDKITAADARKLLAKAPGVVVKDSHKPKGYPTPVSDATGSDAVYVGRIREDFSHPKGLNLWVVSDNIRKGAALNAIQIAEELIKLGV